VSCPPPAGSSTRCRLERSEQRPEETQLPLGKADVPPRGRLRNAPHGLAHLQYAVLVLLGLVGLAIRRRKLLSDWRLWITAIYLSILHLIFHIEARYSLPARPSLMIYSAIGACGLAAWFSHRVSAEHSGHGGRDRHTEAGVC
jgi:hypothetical protein